MQRPFRAGVEVEVVLPAVPPVDRTDLGGAIYACIRESRPDSLILHAPVGPEGPVEPTPGTQIALWRYKGAATYMTTVAVLENRPGDPPLLITTAPSNTRELVRRGYYRVPTRLPFRAGPLKGEVRNISGSGMLAAVPPGSLTRGQTCLVAIDLPGAKGPAGARARVVRVASAEDEDLAGLCLEGIEENMREEIIHYVFRRQRELMRLGELGYPWRRL